MHKVLIAEDDTDQLNLIMKRLEKYREKFEVVPVRDGQEAIDVLKEEQISLVVTDIQMPRMNGMILLAYVHTYHPSIPSFVITAYGTSRLRSKLPKDLLRFFQKPFDVDDLASAIIAALERNEINEDARGISLLDFLDLIRMEETSCIFEIKSSGKPTGYMYFENGVLYDARSGELRAEPAALELIARKDASYGFDFDPPKEIHRKIKTELDELIRNALGDVGALLKDAQPLEC
ncbi:response regulator [Thermodesulfobacteriota bacterium]